ncbi:MAG TPA: asparaginase [Patescibacteria group bacterium]|nr:asparaginase [Patescibacteria group bacterium]
MIGERSTTPGSAWRDRPMVEVWRGERVESLHHGAAVLVDDAGGVVAALGDPGLATYLRSSAKPAQVLPVILSGAAERFGFTESEIAVMIGSHGGEPFHLEAVRSILKRAGIGEEALQCGAHPPFYRPAARALRLAGQEPSALHNNCSGKHAGMLALAAHLGAPIGTYLEPGHPVQQRILEVVARLAGVAAGSIGTAVDGCSAPTFAIPLEAAATLYARLLAPEALPEDLGRASRRAVAAMRRYPEMVAGTERLCTDLMRQGGDGLIAKIGAEGFYGLGYVRGGRGFGLAIKISDGDGDRARPTAAIDALRQLGVLTGPAADEILARHVGPIRNHRGLVVGRVRSCFALAPGA